MEMEGDRREVGTEAGALGRPRGFCFSTRGPGLLRKDGRTGPCPFIPPFSPLGTSAEASVESGGGLGSTESEIIRVNNDYH